MEIELKRIDTCFSGEFCYTHARAAVAPDGFAVMTTQPLRLSGSDIYYGMRELVSRDGGKSWSAICEVPELSRPPVPRQAGTGARHGRRHPAFSPGNRPLSACRRKHGLSE